TDSTEIKKVDACGIQTPTCRLTRVFSKSLQNGGLTTSGDGLFFTVAYTEVLPASLDLLGFSTVAQRSPCFVPVGCTFVSPVGYRCPRQRFSDQRQPLLHWPRFVGVSYRWSWNTPPF